MNNEAVVIMCPPYPEYKEPPADHSHSELFDCPKCKGQMWLSEKKKGYIMFSACLKKDIILRCYKCIEKMMREEEDLLNPGGEIIRVDL